MTVQYIIIALKLSFENGQKRCERNEHQLFFQFRNCLHQSVDFPDFNSKHDVRKPQKKSHSKFKDSNETFWVIFKHCENGGNSILNRAIKMHPHHLSKRANEDGNLLAIRIFRVIMTPTRASLRPKPQLSLFNMSLSSAALQP